MASLRSLLKCVEDDHTARGNEDVERAVDSGRVADAQFVDAATNRAHRARKRHRQALSILQIEDCFTEVMARLLRE